MQTANSKKMIMITLLSLILFSSYLSNSGIGNGVTDPDISKVTNTNPTIQSSFIDSDPILISGNENISQYATVGDGSDWENAYVIEERDFTILNSTPAMHIANTTDFIILKRFVISIHFFDDSSYYWIGLLIENCSNIRIEYGYFSTWRMSGTAIQIENSSDINISTYVTISNYYVGIKLINTTTSEFSGISVGNCRIALFELKNSSYNHFHSNILENSETGEIHLDGISLDKSNYNLIEKNEFQNVDNSLTADFCEGNTYRENLFEDGSPGIFLYASKAALVEGNRFEFSRIGLFNANSTIIRDNTFQYSTVAAMDLFHTYDILIEQNRILSCINEFAFEISDYPENFSDDHNITIKRNTFSGNRKGIIDFSSDVKAVWGWNWYIPQFGYLIMGIGLLMVMWVILIETNGLKIQKRKLKKLGEETSAVVEKTSSDEILDLTKTGILQLNRLDMYRFQLKLGKTLGILACLIVVTHQVISYGGDYLRKLFKWFNNFETLSNDRVFRINFANMILLGLWILAILLIFKIFKQEKSRRILSVERTKILSEIKLWPKILISSIFLGVFISVWFLTNFSSSPLTLFFYGFCLVLLYIGTHIGGFKFQENLILLIGGLFLIIAGIFAGSQVVVEAWSSGNGEFRWSQWTIFLIFLVSAAYLGLKSAFKLEDTDMKENSR